MKITPFLFASLLLSQFPVSAEPKAEDAPAAAEIVPQKLSKSEAEAVEAFKADMLAIQTWLAAERDAVREKEAAAHRLPVKISAKLAKVRTEGLPEILAKTFAAVKKNFAAQAERLKDLPADDTKAMEWMADKTADEKFNQEGMELTDAQFAAEGPFIEAAIACGAGAEADLYQSSEAAQTKDRWVVILGAYKGFAEAKADAEKVAKQTKIPFSLRGMVYDKEGLRLPENAEDEAYAGQYLARRYNEATIGEKEAANHISVELSGEYEGFTPDYFIAVGYIADSAEEAEKKAAEFKKLAPGTYVKKTRIYMGCIH